MDIKNIFTPHKNVARGPGGKFVSKKKPEIKVEVTPVAAPAAPPKEEKKPEEANSPEFEISTFYGKDIRKKKINGTWYFALADVIILANYDNVKSFLQKLPENSKTKKLLSDETKTVDSLEFANFKGISAIVPMTNNKDHSFPGPFLSWLQGISEQ